jgi:hypothetical protein
VQQLRNVVLSSSLEQFMNRLWRDSIPLSGLIAGLSAFLQVVDDKAVAPRTSLAAAKHAARRRLSLLHLMDAYQSSLASESLSRSSADSSVDKLIDISSLEQEDYGRIIERALGYTRATPDRVTREASTLEQLSPTYFADAFHGHGESALALREGIDDHTIVHAAMVLFAPALCASDAAGATLALKLVHDSSIVDTCAGRLFGACLVHTSCAHTDRAAMGVSAVAQLWQPEKRSLFWQSVMDEIRKSALYMRAFLAAAVLRQTPCLATLATSVMMQEAVLVCLSAGMGADRWACAGKELDGGLQTEYQVQVERGPSLFRLQSCPGHIGVILAHGGGDAGASSTDATWLAPVHSVPGLMWAVRAFSAVRAALLCDDTEQGVRVHFERGLAALAQCAQDATAVVAGCCANHILAEVVRPWLERHVLGSAPEAESRRRVTLEILAGSVKLAEYAMRLERPELSVVEEAQGWLRRVEQLSSLPASRLWGVTVLSQWTDVTCPLPVHVLNDMLVTSDWTPRGQASRLVSSALSVLWLCVHKQLGPVEHTASLLRADRPLTALFDCASPSAWLGTGDHVDMFRFLGRASAACAWEDTDGTLNMLRIVSRLIAQVQILQG